MKKYIFLFLIFFLSEKIFSQNIEYGNNQKVGKTLHLKDADIYYEIYGKGKPLFLLHGNGGSIDAFKLEIS